MPQSKERLKWLRANDPEWKAKQNAREKAYYYANIEKRKQKSLDRYARLIKEDSEGHKRRTHNNSLKRRYGISLDDYNIILYLQDGCCSICKRSSPSSGKKYFDVDHDHLTKKVRGLLCNPCNRSLGHLNDDASIFRAAADYLDRHNNAN